MEAARAGPCGLGGLGVWEPIPAPSEPGSPPGPPVGDGAPSPRMAVGDVPVSCLAPAVGGHGGPSPARGLPAVAITQRWSLGVMLGLSASVCSEGPPRVGRGHGGVRPSPRLCSSTCAERFRPRRGQTPSHHTAGVWGTDDPSLGPAVGSAPCPTAVGCWSPMAAPWWHVVAALPMRCGVGDGRGVACSANTRPGSVLLPALCCPDAPVASSPCPYGRWQPSPCPQQLQGGQPRGCCVRREGDISCLRWPPGPIPSAGSAGRRRGFGAARCWEQGRVCAAWSPP